MPDSYQDNKAVGTLSNRVQKLELAQPVLLIFFTEATASVALMHGSYTPGSYAVCVHVR